MLPLPAQLFSLQFSLTSFVIGFTSSSSLVRVSLIPIIILCTWQCVTTSKLHIQRNPWAALIGGYSITYLLQYISIALLGKWNFELDAIQRKDALAIDHEHMEKVTLHTSPIPFLARLKYGIAAAPTFRYQMEKKKNVRPLASSGGKSTAKRSTFLYHTAFKILTTYLILDLMGQGANGDSNAKNFAPTKVPLLSRLHEVSVVEVMMRVLVILGAGVGIYCS